MLGRQQIAGIPTAISELFKNAHDAYADIAEVDYLRYASTFILRDDGLGMSRSDFEDRWLVLGTESKVPVAGALPLGDPAKARRAILGEKGIGRLAIAAIGPQVLILTRPKYPDHSTLTAAFIHWDLFTLPGINHDELQIPIQTCTWGSIPSKETVENLKSDVRAVLRHLGERVSKVAREKILRDLASFNVDPESLDQMLGAPSLLYGHGTHFYISPTDNAFDSALATRSDDVASPLVKMLIGFSNTMIPYRSTKIMQTAFRDHEDEFGNFYDVIAESEFFTPDEFANADHHLSGHFDAFGQFTGDITVYGQQTANYVIPFNARGAKTQCGPFAINVAVVQGAERESTLPAERWASLYAKLNKIGGLYIYRDGVRVLPYGNNDYDFIDLEKRRSLSARYYYFSYRRIFGVIDIDSENNAELVEKAGREGFRENVAYRQFRDILENFFINVAASFFREGGARAEIFTQKRSELDRLERARRKREKLASERRASFVGQLENNFERIGRGDPQKEAAAIVSSLADALALYKNSDNVDYAQRGFLKAQEAALRRVSELRSHYRAARPRGVGLPQRVRRDLDAYNSAVNDMIETVVEPAEREVESLLQKAALGSLVAIDRRVRFHRAIERSTEEAKEQLASLAKATTDASTNLRVAINLIVRNARIALDDVVNSCLAEAASINIGELSDEEFVDRRLSIESKVVEEAERQSQLLREVSEQLQSLTWERDETGELISGLDLAESVNDEILELRERLDVDLELSQLGMAVKIINHEFESSIRVVRASLRKLRAWSDANPPIRSIYDSISTSFEHLDAYLRLFTPLQRRLYRTAVVINGQDIAKFINELFEERARRDEVQFLESRAFKTVKILGYPSTYYPVFINLVDNALYWVQQTDNSRIISFDGIDGALIVANTGPAIAPSDRERIFEQGFSRRPSGRGLGLYISREVLRGVGGDLSCTDPPTGFGAAFKILLPNEATAKV